LSQAQALLNKLGVKGAHLVPPAAAFLDDDNAGVGGGEAEEQRRGEGE
jgi:hypothetical protein